MLVSAQFVCHLSIKIVFSHAKHFKFHNSFTKLKYFRYQTASFVGRRVEAFGWGTLEFGGPKSSRLMKVNFDVVNQSRCESAYGITSAQLCTFTRYLVQLFSKAKNSFHYFFPIRNKDTCSYDSGGPLMYTDSTVNNLLYQVGITSYGINCASSTPSVSTKITAYLDWIQKTTPYAIYCVR